MIKIPTINYELEYGTEEYEKQWERLYKFQQDWEDNGRPINNHICDGLREFQLEGSDNIDKTLGKCEPNISPDGFVRGCDAYNKYQIKYCPFCGVKLDG